MKRLMIVSFIFVLNILTSSAFAATVGGPELSIPEESVYLRQKAINETLNRYDYNMNIKASADIEIIFKKKLDTTSEVTDAKIEGQNYMVKISDNFFDIFEPYIKIGTSNLKVKWDQNGNGVTVETEPGFVWGMGAKVKVWEFRNSGVKLTLDGQYRDIDLDVHRISLSNAINEKFEIKEWQFSLLASKKFILPLGLKDYYIAPYAGITYSSTKVDVSFTESTTGLLYSTYYGGDKAPVGVVFGCDIMSSQLSWYLFNLELRLVNETAFSLGGTIKF